MHTLTPSYRGHRFPPEIISHAFWLYYRFCLSFRDVEDLLAERGRPIRKLGRPAFAWLAWRDLPYSM